MDQLCDYLKRAWGDAFACPGDACNLLFIQAEGPDALPVIVVGLRVTRRRRRRGPIGAQRALPPGRTAP